MRFYDLKFHLRDYVVFSINDIRKFEPKFHHPRLNEWQKKGYIQKIRRGYYCFTDLRQDEETLFLIANRLYAPSYVSFESALAYHGLIPEGVYSITSATTKKTVSFKSSLTFFTYRKIKPALNFGYVLAEINGRWYKLAEMEKAFLDYLYLHPRIAQAAEFHEWRFNGRDFLARVDLVKLRRYAAEYGNTALTARLEKILVMMNRSD